MMGHLLHVLGGKKIRRSEGGRRQFCDRMLFFFGGGFVLPCGAPDDLFIKSMPVRVIQPILYRNQTTLQHGLIG